MEHPRARGENLTAFETKFEEAGTSPRTRGKLAGVIRVVGEGGEHPRARGENLTAFETTFEEAGTSPRTRGKLEDENVTRPDGGNIPAHAGKTGEVFTMVESKEEHPRARGENPYCQSPPNCGGGTSPRTRGKQRVGCGH